LSGTVGRTVVPRELELDLEVAADSAHASPHPDDADAKR
jgi:hypothetical protein